MPQKGGGEKHYLLLKFGAILLFFLFFKVSFNITVRCTLSDCRLHFYKYRRGSAAFKKVQSTGHICRKH